MKKMTSRSDQDVVLQQPLNILGAQEVATFHGGCTKNGFLRKQGKLERMFKFLTWRQRYVVISKGCLYVFKNEFSRSYLMAVALRTYNKTIRCTDIPRMPYVFRVMPHDPTRDKILVFSCPDEVNQKSWMAAIKKDLLKANDVSTAHISDDSLEDYVYIEKDVRTIKEEIEAHNKELDPETDYSEISDMDVRTIGKKTSSPHSTTSLPQAGKKKQGFTYEPPKSSTIASSQPHADPAHTNTKGPRPSPRANNQTFQKNGKVHGQKKKQRKPSDTEEDDKPIIDRKSYMFEGSNREHVEGLLLSKTEGTFLIRTSRNDGREVLSINIGDTLKEFKIYIKDKKCTIDNKTYFDSTDELLLYYHENNLPNKEVKLTKAYLLQSAGYVNQRLTDSTVKEAR